MPNICFVPNCTTGYKRTEANKHISTFRIPKDREMRNKWQNKIARPDKPLTEISHVCELHFEDKFIIRDIEIRLPNGEIEKRKRSRPILRSDAIPTIMPNLNQTAEIFRKTKSRKSSIRKNNKKQTTPVEVRRRSVPMPQILFVPIPEFESYGDEFLFEQINSMSFPNENYTCTKTNDDTIIIQRWENDYARCNKHIVIRDMKLKVYINDVVIKALNNGIEKEWSVDEIPNLLQILENSK